MKKVRLKSVGNKSYAQIVEEKVGISFCYNFCWFGINFLNKKLSLSFIIKLCFKIVLILKHLF
jgi:hypothetical protein